MHARPIDVGKACLTGRSIEIRRQVQACSLERRDLLGSQESRHRGSSQVHMAV